MYAVENSRLAKLNIMRKPLAMLFERLVHSSSYSITS
jgi:hypothetical protein